MADLITILKQAGFSGERLREAYAIAMRESGGRPDAHNDNRATGDDSRGIFQINMLDDLGPARDAKFKQYVKGYTGIESLFDPVVNARAAAYMSRKGEDWTSWVSPQYGAAAQHYANYPGDNSTGSDIAPQGAAPTDRSAGKKPKDTPQTAEEAAAANSISWDFVLAHPVIHKIIDKAIADGWLDGSPIGQQRFTNAIQNTDWYKENNKYARQYLFNQSTGGQDFQRQLKDARDAVTAEATRIGARLDPAALDKFAQQYLLNGWYDQGRTQNLTKALAGELPDFNSDFIQYDKGGASAFVSQLKKIADDNGVSFSEDYYTSAARQILVGAGTLEDYVAEIRGKGATLYPMYADRVGSGAQTLRQIASPYVQKMADVLELDPNSISLTDPNIGKALGGVDDKGNPAVMGLGDFAKSLRQDERWQYTKAANTEVDQLTSKIVSMFGFSGGS